MYFQICVLYTLIEVNVYKYILSLLHTSATSDIIEFKVTSSVRCLEGFLLNNINVNNKGRCTNVNRNNCLDDLLSPSL